jgi:hypothetical protein
MELARSQAILAPAELPVDCATDSGLGGWPVR